MKTYFSVLLIVLALPLFSQPVNDSIPMRDGKYLHADIYIPQPALPRPTILIQTPYCKCLFALFGLPLSVGFNINSSNYNFVVADWRCFFSSAPACTTGMNRGEDGYDCVEWIAQQSWSDGKVGTWGPSALGVIQFQTAREHPPSLVCGVPLVASPYTPYEKYYPGGVLRTEYVQTLDSLGFGVGALIMSQPYYNFIWQLSEASTNYSGDIEVPMLMIGGWYDHETDLVLDFYAGLRSNSPSPVNTQHRLLMGPWTHNTTSSSPLQVGDLSYPAAQGWSDSIALQFFDYHLRNISNGWNTSPFVQYFQMGEDTWNNDTAWHTGNMTQYNLYFKKNGSMDLSLPASSTDSMMIVYDPRDPSPTVGGPTLYPSLDQGPYDQVPVVESRNDVLVFTSDSLVQNVKMKGKAKVHLFVSSDMPDTDFAIRLTDVYPDGRSMLLADGIHRMRFRNGYTTGDTASMIPGTVYQVDVDLPHLAHTFIAGHKIRIDVTSSNYPRYDSNLNNGDSMYVAGDTNVANNVVFVNSVNPSHAILPLESFPSGMEATGLLPGAIAYPNPASDILTVIIPGVSTVLVTMFDMAGKKVCDSGTMLSHGKSEIPVSELSPGIYLLQVQTGSTVISKKVSVLRQ